MDTQVADNLIGTLVDGRYRVRSRVARGGMATVYTAVDERLERTVALKIIHPGQAIDRRFVDRFTDEAKTIARLTHPNVVAVYDQGTHQGLPYLIMEFVRGRTLRDILTDTGRMEPADALAVLEQMLAAVAAAHRAGVVHRDVKPENVLVADAPSGSNLVDAVVKVADFGLARAVEASADDGDGQLLATVAYVAPELVTEGRADPRSDVYSVGIVLFEMVTGRVPYDDGKPIEIAWRHVDEDVPRPSKVAPDLPPEIDTLVAQATARDAQRRPADAGAMLSAVQAARDALEAGAGLRGRTLAQPTVLVDTVTPSAPATDRPAWSRLPRERSGAGHRRAAATGRATERAADRAGTERAGEWAGSGRATERGAARASGTRAAARAAGGRSAGTRATGTTHRSGATDGRLERIASSPAAAWFAQVMSRRNGRRTFYATLAVLALVVILTGWYFGFGRYTSTPSVAGRTQAAATALLHTDGFSVTIGQPVFDPRIPTPVVRQNPAAQSKIIKGGTVQLILSKGPEQYPLPDEVGRSFAIAQQNLAAIKMDVKTVYAYDNHIDEGFVISTNPKAGVVEKPGTVVTVTVSKGRAPITVPNVIGTQFSQADQTLTQLGLVVAQTQKSSASAPAGQVMDQSLKEGYGTVKGTTIVLTVSSGPPMVHVPNLVNLNYTFQQAQDVLKQYGLTAVDVFDVGGQVRQQSPAPGTSVPQGSQVQVWIEP